MEPSTRLLRSESNYEVGDAVVGPLLSMAGFDFAVEELMKIDSLDMTDAQRSHIVERVSASPLQHVLITHGTDDRDGPGAVRG